MARLAPAIGAPPIPREHGAWAMLATAIVVGLARAGIGNAGALLAGAGILLLFLARSTSVTALARTLEGRKLPSGHLTRRLLWAGLYLAAACLCFAFVLAGSAAGVRAALARAAVLPLVLGGVHAALGVAGRDRTLLAELLGMAGLAATAPLVVAAAGRPVDGEAAGTAVLALLYFLSSLSFVRAYRRIRSHGAMAIGSCIAAHAALALALAGAVHAGWLPPAAWLAFAPVAARTAWGILRPPRDLRVLGLREIAVATIFLMLAALAVAQGS